MTAVNTSSRARIILAALVLILGAYWAGARFGPREPTNVEAVPPGGSSSPAAVGSIIEILIAGMGRGDAIEDHCDKGVRDHRTAAVFKL